jgi:hypothetical protein
MTTSGAMVEEAAPFSPIRYDTCNTMDNQCIIKSMPNFFLASDARKQ